MSKHGWTYKKLGDVCVSDLGKTLNQSKDTGNLRPYLCAVNIQWDKIDLSLLKETRFEDNELERYSVVKGDLLVCEGGDVGRAAIWNDENPIQYQNALHRVRFDNQMTARFCLYFLYYLKLSGELDSKYSKGVTIKHLVKSSLLSIPLPVPSRAEQEAIVAELDEINEAIAGLRQQVADLDTLAQATFYDMFGDPVTNPKGWDVKKLGEACILMAGGDVPKQRFSKEKTSEYHIPIYSNGIENKGLYGYTDIARITEPSITISGRGTIGFVAKRLDPFYPVVRLIVATPKIDINITYLEYYGISMHFDGNGVAIPQLTVPMIKNVALPLPPLTLQQEFAAKVEAIEAAKAELNSQIGELQTLLAARMDHYFD